MAKAKAKAKSTAKPKVDTSTHKPGQSTDLTGSVIALVPGARNPASGDRKRRFALMANGMTVGEWYAACRNDSAITGKAHKGLVTLAIRKGYITLKAPAK
tara:strand:- start:55 stop:354 length:300 start_codon:yes stop_codon:yes gene_type:complete